MAYFSVVLHGGGILINRDSDTEKSLGLETRLDGEPEDPITGFYAARWVRGSSEKVAISAAKLLILEEWSRPPLKELNRGNPPELTVDKIERVGVATYLKRRFRMGGFTFYSDTSAGGFGGFGDV